MATRPQAEIDITARNRVQRAVDQATLSLRGLERTARLTTAALAAIPVVELGRKYIEMADRAQAVENRLRLVTESATELAAVQSELFRLAQNSNASFEGTVNLYSRMARATSELGISQERLLRVTDTINKAIAVSGAASQEAEAALIQLSQGIAAGALRGEELNSVLEQTPRLAQAIAEGMGVTIGQLRELGKEGRITAETVIQALERQASTINREFGQMDTTVGQAMQGLSNSMLRLVGSVDDATGSSQGLAWALRQVSRALDELTEEGSAANAIWETALNYAFEQTLRTMGPLGQQAALLAGAIKADGDAARAAAEEFSSLAAAQAEHLRVMRDLTDRRRREAQSGASSDEREAAEKQLEQIREFTLSREQIELESHARRLEGLRTALELELIDKRRFDELSIQLAQKTQERITAIQSREDDNARREQLQQQLEQVREAALTREQVELEAHARRLQILREALQNELIDQARFGELSIQLALQTQQRIDEIRGESEQARLQERLQQQLEQVRQFSLTREQVELEAHARRMEVLRAAFEAELIEKQRFDELAVQLAQQTQERITAIQREEEAKRGESTRDLMLSQVQNTLQGFATLVQASEGGSKRLFKIHKALALASAIVSTHKSVAEALATPPVPNIPLAALAAAKGAVEIAGIASQNLGGGSGGSFAGGGGGGGAAAPAAPPLPRIPERSEARGQVNIEVSLAGATIVGPGGVEQFADTLVEVLRDRVENRDEVIITASSRQAAELRS